MTMFGLKEAEVATLVRSVAGDLDRSQIRDHFARAAWTGIAEPGDRVAGLVVESLGAATALDALMERWPVEKVAAAVHHAGVDGTAQEELAKGIDRWRPRVSPPAAVLALQQAHRFSARLLVPDGPNWPVGLADLGLHAPIALWIRGTDAAIGALSTSIAIVGARAATGYGEHVTMEASAGLVDRGFAIVSGAAYGIDGMAHRAALASSGQTVAILAGGVDRFYPSGHDALLSRIAQAGAVLSELPCGQPPTRWRFLQRNRLIAAVSGATVVVEAGWRSGSLNTANHAAAIGRPVGVVPGPVTSAASAGCHRLLRESEAVLVTNPDEMAQLVGSSEGSLSSRSEPRPGDGAASTGPGDSPLHTRVLDALSTRSPRSVRDVAARAGTSVQETQAALGMLALDGRVSERESGWIKTGSRA